VSCPVSPLLKPPLSRRTDPPCYQTHVDGSAGTPRGLVPTAAPVDSTVARGIHNA
jgi:hypothetical protein